MAFYCLVEGRRTEMELYPFWLSQLNPKYKAVSKIVDIADPNHYCIQSGFGHPQLKKYILKAKEKIAKHNINISHFLIVVDSEDNDVNFRRQQYQKYIDENFTGASYKIEIIVQPICIESWLLGNTKIFTTRKKHDQKLADFTAFYNVKQLDPELLPSLSSKILIHANTKADFYFQYLKKVISLRSNGKFAYKKEKPGFVCNNSYLKNMTNRVKCGHLKNFKQTINLLKSL